MNNINIIFTITNINTIEKCTINDFELKLPSDELYKVFNNFKRKYPNTRKTIESNTYQDTFNSIDSNELFKLITSSLNYQKSIFSDKKRNIKKV